MLFDIISATIGCSFLILWVICHIRFKLIMRKRISLAIDAESCIAFRPLRFVPIKAWRFADCNSFAVFASSSASSKSLSSIDVFSHSGKLLAQIVPPYSFSSFSVNDDSIIFTSTRGIIRVQFTEITQLNRICKLSLSAPYTKDKEVNVHCNPIWITVYSFAERYIIAKWNILWYVMYVAVSILLLVAKAL